MKEYAKLLDSEGKIGHVETLRDDYSWMDGCEGEPGGLGEQEGI